MRASFPSRDFPPDVVESLPRMHSAFDRHSLAKVRLFAFRVLYQPPFLLSSMPASFFPTPCFELVDRVFLKRFFPRRTFC